MIRKAMIMVLTLAGTAQAGGAERCNPQVKLLCESCKIDPVAS